MLDTMQFIQKLIDEKIVAEDIASVKFTDVEANFVGGQTAMAILGNWHYPLMKDSGGEEFISKAVSYTHLGRVQWIIKYALRRVTEYALSGQIEVTRG